RYHNKHSRATNNLPGCLIWDEDDIIQRRITEIKSKSRWCILVIHGGDEFCMTPFPEIRNRYLRFLDWGADIIVAHHPHVVQNYEYVSEKIIFYSLGNFLFDDNYMRVFAESKEGILLKLDLQEDDCSWEYMPIYIDGDAAQIRKTESPTAFNCIADDADYLTKVRIAMKDYLVKERKNLKFQAQRKDIKLKGKCRIILSHIKRYLKLLKKSSLLIN
ncbi:MAG: CapA family protein, partial [Ruminococcaceae bacterium]|nr:CapA family protein [Oscillospiraceae bacterium]